MIPTRSTWAVLAPLGLAALALACSSDPANTNALQTQGPGTDVGMRFGDGGPADGSGLSDTGPVGLDAATDPLDSGAATTDAAGPDAGVDAAGGADVAASKDVGAGGDTFGKPCKSDQQCFGGACIEGYNGFVCTVLCGPDTKCAAGWLCKKVYGEVGAAPQSLCVPDISKLCQPCTAHADCLGGVCVSKGGEQFCASTCPDAGCPASHTCDPVDGPDGAGPVDVCMPKSGSCSCTPQSAGLVRACKQSAGPLTCYGVQHCNASGWSGCVLSAEVCDGEDNNCDGKVDEGFVDAQGKYTTAKACGACGNNCTFLSFDHAKPVCTAAGTSWGCAMACDGGYFDVNDNPNDGCECHKTGALDHPDGTDHNCDGVDGEVLNAVFAAKNGSDKAAGTLLAPVLTVGKAIALAKSKGLRDVYVSSGVYEESIALVDQVHVYGGYSGDFLSRDPVVYETVIMGKASTTALPGAVNAVSFFGAKATFDGFTVFGANNKTKGGSSYAVYLRDVDTGLRLSQCKIIAGDGANGQPGLNGGNGEGGVGGKPGIKAKDVGTSTCTSSKHSAGGASGQRTCGGSNVSGGAGGAAVCPDYDEDGAQPKSSPYKQTLTAAEAGKSGNGSGPGKGGSSGYDSIIWEGSGSGCGVCNPPKTTSTAPFLPTVGVNGADGKAGALGSAGSGCASSAGSVVNGLWKPGSAQAGGNGAHGSGGGGGGAGGGVEVSSKCTSSALFKYPDLGGSGGGGGSGGCSGQGGTAGTSGGGSFAVFLSYSKPPPSLPEIAGNTLVTGNGGDGGAGGQGGVAGTGGEGAFGGGDDGDGLAWCASAGGAGGRGGDGGHGGGSGGGCGGVSFGLYVASLATSQAAGLKTANTVTVLGVAGQGGQGGKSLGKDGGDGAAGAGGKANY